MDRREFFTWTVGGALLVALPASAANSEATTAFPWIRIGPDGGVQLTVTASDMGQGAQTGQAQILADELDVAWDRVSITLAPDAQPYQLDGELYTGGSSSIAPRYELLRRAGAAVRAQLTAVAAASWGVPTEACEARLGKVHHPKSGRVLGYGDLASAAAAVLQISDPPLKQAAQRRYVGQPMKPKNIASKVDGSAVYGIDVRLPGMKFATLRQCPVHAGTLASVDPGPALALGATKVVSLKNAVAVIASDTWTAFNACAALAPEWALPTSRTDSQDVARRLETAQDADDSLIRKAGDGDAKVFRERLRESYARAPRRVEASYQLPYLAHATLEPMNATAWVTKEDVQVWAPTQAQTVVRREVATALNRPLSEVAVHTTLMGGGFGRRLKADFAVQAALVAQAVEGPVQLLWRREEDFGHDFYRPAGRVSYRAALATTGEIESLELIGATTDDVAFGGSGPSPYSIAAFAASQKQIATGVPVGAWRSVDACITVFAKESFIDECALAAGVDPLSYRLRLLGNNHRARRVLEAAASGIEWQRSRPEGHGIGLALFSGWGSIVAHAVEVEIEGESLRVQQIVVAGDCGTAINPAQVQTQWEGAALQALSVALGEEVTFTGGVADQTNFDSYRLLRMAQAPTVKVILVDSPDVPVGGVGEPGTPGLPAALANAIFAASGQRVRTLPLTSQGYRV